MGDDNKVIKGAPVNFEGDTTIKADTLEQTTETQTQTNQIITTGNQNLDFLKENFFLKPDMVWRDYTKNNEDYRKQLSLTKAFNNIENIYHLLPTLLRIRKQSKGVFQYICNYNADLIKTELEIKYGPDLKKTGIYDILIKKDNDFVPRDLEKYFGEFIDFNNLYKSYGYIINNPFLTLYALPLEQRSFFAGVLKDNPDLCKCIDTNIIENFSKPITIVHAMKYAKDHNEPMEKIGEYMKMYLEL